MIICEFPKNREFDIDPVVVGLEGYDGGGHTLTLQFDRRGRGPIAHEPEYWSSVMHIRHEDESHLDRGFT